MRKQTIVWIVVVVIIIGAGGWYWWMTMSAASNSYQPQPANSLGLNGSPNQSNTGTPVNPALTIAHNSTLGDYLVAANGMTLYSFTKDAKNVSNCTRQCAVIWPPYAPANQNPLMPGTGVSGTISTISRADGITQITYNGVPLYYWKGDSKPGDTTGQNYNGLWFVVKP